jgi:exopolysaccharide biosynthesis predicted pyruvyltransferase EpsI
MSLNTQVINEQASLLTAVVSRLLKPGEPYALVDFPDHYNVGDSAIWLGEVALLGRLLKRAPSYVSKVENFDAQALRVTHPSGPILIHGGGNFGDIWPKHQIFREMLMAEFPDRQIIQLPQSLSFKSEANISRCAEAIRQHGRFHLLVRDRRSLAFAQANLGCGVDLTPDMAFGMGPLALRGRPTHDVFMLLREDPERTESDRSPLLALPNSRAADWLEESPRFDQWTRLTTRVQSLGQGGLDAPSVRWRYYNRLAAGRVERGLKMLSSGRVVITDRLHAHILSTMLDVPNIVLDNNYGKIHGYMDAWTHAYPATRKASTPQEAVELLSGLQAEVQRST